MRDSPLQLEISSLVDHAEAMALWRSVRASHGIVAYAYLRRINKPHMDAPTAAMFYQQVKAFREEVQAVADKLYSESK